MNMPTTRDLPCNACGYTAWRISAETGKVLFCEVCDTRDQLRDALSQEHRLKAERDALATELAQSQTKAETRLGVLNAVQQQRDRLRQELAQARGQIVALRGELEWWVSRHQHSYLDGIPARTRLVLNGADTASAAAARDEALTGPLKAQIAAAAILVEETREFLTHITHKHGDFCWEAQSLSNKWARVFKQDEEARRIIDLHAAALRAPLEQRIAELEAGHPTIMALEERVRELRDERDALESRLLRTLRALRQLRDEINEMTDPISARDITRDAQAELTRPNNIALLARKST